MKYLLIILLALAFTSCESSPKPDDIIIPQESDAMTIQAYKFSYEDHDYIYFKHGYGQIGTAGVTHDPACRCHEQ